MCLKLTEYKWNRNTNANLNLTHIPVSYCNFLQ